MLPPKFYYFKRIHHVYNPPLDRNNLFGPTIIPKTTRTDTVTEALFYPTPRVRDVAHVTKTTNAAIAKTTSVIAVVVPIA